MTLNADLLLENYQYTHVQFNRSLLQQIMADSYEQISFIFFIKIKLADEEKHKQHLYKKKKKSPVSVGHLTATQHGNITRHNETVCGAFLPCNFT